MEHHPTIFQIPNFLGVIGISGAWVPEHVTMAWLVMAILVSLSYLATRKLEAVPGPIPGLKPPTANLNTTAALAITVFLSYNYFGIREHGIIAYLRHFCGPILWLSPIMFPIEFIGHLARPISLSIRLFGNIFGEESVIIILLS